MALDAWNPHLVVAGEVGREALGVVSLQLVVKLCAQNPCELPGQAHPVDVRQHVQVPAGLPRPTLENREVLLDLLPRPRTANLDDDLGSVVQACGVGLPDRRRGKWMEVEPRERFGAEFLFDDALDGRGGDH